MRLLPLLLLAAAVPGDTKDAVTEVRAAIKRGDVAAAEKAAAAAVKRAPTEPRAHLLHAEVMLAKRDFDAAVADCDRAIALDPKSGMAYDLRGTANFKRAKIKESLADYDKQIELEPQAAAAHWRRGLVLYYADEFAKGVAQFTTSDQAEPEDVENAIWHLLCNAKVAGLEKAQAAMLKVKQDPRGESMMKAYALFKGTAKPDEVLTAAEAGEATAARRQSQRFYANYYVGMYYEMVGEAKKSLEYLKTAVEKYPIGDYMMDVARVHIKLRSK